MGYYTGRDGHLSFRRLLSDGSRDTRRVAKVRNWSLTTNVALLPTTTLEDFADSFVPSTKGGSGSATIIYYRLEPGVDDLSARYQFTALLRRIMKRGAIESTDKVRLELNVSPAAVDDIVIDAWITSARIASATSELTEVEIQFTQDGDFQEVIDQALGAPYVES